jgi:DNA invertase Pin-like site-specific DNA recombinase
MNTKAFGYLRVSGKSQLDGDGFPRQRAAIQAYAAANNIEMVEWFEEKAVCGATESFDRPAWSEMVGRLNGTRTIIVEKLDRLAREVYVQEYVQRDLAKRDVTLLTADGQDMSDIDPTRVLFRQILACVAQYDRAMIVAKLKSARDRKKRDTGSCEGVKRYGTLNGESDVLDRMTRMRSEGMTFDAIAAELNEHGVPTRYGKAWYGTTVRKILAVK